jgi:dihydroorotase
VKNNINNIVTIDAVCVESSGVQRKKISFNPLTGLIESMGHGPSQIDYYFNDDCLLFAGMGDIHIHAREDVSQKNIYKEDFTSAKNAGLNGGLVHACDMPNNPIPPVDDASYLDKLKLAAKSQYPFMLYAGIGPHTRPLSFQVPYKVYMGPSIGELFFTNLAELRAVLSHYKGEWVSFHCEDPEILEQNKNQASHFLKRPVEAEIIATQHALDLIEEFQLKGKLCHYSAKVGLQLIKNHKARGSSVTCEVTPQHLYFSEEFIDLKKETAFQMNPPIRKETNRQALLAAFKKGEIDFLATDHAPHSPLEKAQGMSGLSGLDTYAGFVTWLLEEERVDPRIIAKTCSENPGAFFNNFLPKIENKADIYQGLGNGFGFLLPGFSASFTILNLASPTVITKEFLKTKSIDSPFLDITFPGSLEALFLKGKIVSGKSKYLSV